MPRRFANPRPTTNDLLLAGFEHPFNAGIRVGMVAFAGGTASLDPNGRVLFPDDLASQTEACMNYFNRVLTDLGASMEDVVSLNNFYGTTQHLQAAPQVQARYFKRGTTLSGVVAGSAADPSPLFFDSHLVLEAELVAIVGQAKTFADPPGLYSGLGGGKFHQGVRCGDLIHVAGQVALDREGAVLHRGDMPAQTRIVMERIDQVLRDLGASLGDLVSMRTYFVGHEGWEEAVKARAEYLSDGPTNTSVRTSSLVLPELLVQIEAVAIVGASKEFIDPPDHHATIEAPFHHGVRCGNMIFVGGQGPFDSNGDVVNPGDIVGQTPIAMDNLKRVVDALGGSMDDVVQYHTYYIGREDLQATIPIRSSYFKQGKGPVTRGIVADALGHAGVAITFEAVAITDD